MLGAGAQQPGILDQALQAGTQLGTAALQRAQTTGAPVQETPVDQEAPVDQGQD